MSFLDSIKRGIRLVKLDGSAAIEIASDSSSTTYGWVMVLISSLIVALGGSIDIVPFDFQKFLINFVLYIAFIALGILIFHGIAKLFGGQAKLNEYFRAQSHVSLTSWLFIFSWIFAAIQLLSVSIIIGLLVILWSIVIGVVVLKSVHKLSTWKAIFVLFAPLVLVILIITFLGFMLGFIRGFLGPAYKP